MLYEVDQVKIPSVATETSRKRIHAELGELESRRESLREGPERSAQSLNAHHFQVIPMQNPRLLQSFSSASTGVSTTGTSPNHSFRTDLTSMSFENSKGTTGSQAIDLTGKDQEMRDAGFPTLDQVILDPDDIQPPQRVRSKTTSTRHFQEWLDGGNPFNDGNLLVDQKRPGASPSFRVLHEIQRASEQSGMSTQALYDHLISCGSYTTDDYGVLWSDLSAFVARSTGKVLRGRSHPAAWKNANASFDHVGLSGDLKFVSSSEGTMLQFKLKPLKLQASHRLARKYGGDRFLVVGFPTLDEKSLPQALKNDATDIRSAIVEWIGKKSHHVLGREWCAFGCKPSDRAAKSGKSAFDNVDAISHRIYLFATNGFGIHRRNEPRFDGLREPVSKAELLQWLIPFTENLDKPLLKIFSRIPLGTSTTC